MIAVDGRKCWTLFESGARNTYVTPSVAELLKTSPTPRTIRTALGGAIKETNTEAFLHAEIEGHPVSTYALVIKDIARMKMVSQSKSCLARWLCNSGESDSFLPKRNSTFHITQKSSWNSKSACCDREAVQLKVMRNPM